MRMDRNIHLSTGAAAIGLVLLSAIGCGRSDWKSRTYPTSGSVTINGAPPKDAVVKLIKLGEPIDTRQSDCWGIVQEDGTYVLTTYEPGDGAPAGEYAWIIRWPVHLTAFTTDQLGEQFWNPESPHMTVTIKSGRNEISPVELTNIELKQSNAKPASLVMPK
ncbi:hypothetical protein LOC68_03025 [Blastopirellula sp. JC732]|uniref:Carboxypeptidase regulatory-like domain-containing protein n=1 Tax=Blastopirellula sediminis TaxID=2894196 RepID=A0A9X1SF17_9BACT|nr:hypothetical protein [Blastopirellula sediminis]MCC9607850.1 hypothetical protein [Blastopirellula sediminis]MCC9627357.1 hypothetical protein [Blastopirellula sediminis]